MPRAENQKGSYAELMTIALVGELRSQHHVGDWFELIKVEYRALFPELPHRTRYYRILKSLERIFADFALRFSEGDSLHVIDSKPLPICKGVRWKRSRAMTEATSGWGSLGPFYGFKLHMAQRVVGFLIDIRNGQEDDVSPKLEQLLGRKSVSLEAGLKTLFGL